MKYVLVCNAGSSSLRFSLYTWPGKNRVGYGEFEGIGSGRGSLSYSLFLIRGSEQYHGLRTHRFAASVLADLLKAHNVEQSSLRAVVHRIVFGGRFLKPVSITPHVEQELQKTHAIAPLHNPPALDTLRTLRSTLKGVPHCACFDTSYFVNLPQRAQMYAIDYRVASRYNIQRFGFHGLSHAAVSRKAAQVLKKPLQSLNLITMHLGAGCSITAIRNGKPIDTSMGFSPLEGLVMAKRPGDLDPEVILHLARSGLSISQLNVLLNYRSGLFGLSGYSDDMKDILHLAGYPVRGHQLPRKARPVDRVRARMALELFVYRLRKYIGAYAAVLGRVNALVFTGAIGEQSAPIRRLTVRKLILPGKPAVLVAHADEEAEMIRAASPLLR